MTEIQLYNTRTRTKERFEPLRPGDVRMYVCGPTVYDRAHIGNARPVVVFDVLYRLMRHVYGDDAVTYVRNFTDVDDKIIARAQETLGEGESLEAACHRITEETIRWYREDMGALGALAPTHEPRCTEYIPRMVEMIERLIAAGCAYEAEGHVLFDVATYPEYGKLSRRSLEDMQAGARVEVAPYKRNATDFVLWKPSTPEQPGWPSPWGRGRPGWHIECSAMAEALLGETFDIHAGGIDLLFPHHENEVAQSCCANHTEVMANFWLHNGFLQVEGEKMAKSLGNFFTVRDLLNGVTSADGEFSVKPVHPMVLRLALLMTQYRNPLDWGARRRHEATQAIKRWTEAVASPGLNFVEKLGDGKIGSEFVGHLCDDLNTPAAFAEIDELVKAAKRRDEDAAAMIFGSLKWIGINLDRETLQLVAASKESNREGLESSMELGLVRSRVDALLDRRASARKQRDFARADRIRDDLIAAGVVIKDTPQGTEWELSPDFDLAKLPEVSDA